MISLTIAALLLHVLICTSGLAIIQMSSGRNRINIPLNLPFAWGLGVAVVYILGSVMVGYEISVTFWHWILLLILLLLSAIGSLLYIKGSAALKLRTDQISYGIFDLIVVLGLLCKIGLITYITFVNPIIDSDAGSSKGYFSLTRAIVEGLPFSEILQNHITHLHSAISPPILSAWSALFFDRWHISFASLPWLFSYFALLGVVFITVLQVSKNISLSLVGVWLYSTVFLLIIHTIRPGYHDALVAYFFTCQMSIMTLIIINKIQFNATWFVLMSGSLIGLYLSKIGGKLFSVLILGFWVNYYLNHYRRISIRTLMRFQAELIFVFGSSFILLHKNIIAPTLTHMGVNDVLATLLPSTPHELALTQFRRHLYEWSSFGMLWWVMSILYVLSWIRNNTHWEKLLLFFIGAVYFCAFYVCNFTIHAWVEDATTTGRFFLQIIGLALPCYCLFLSGKKQISPEESSISQ